MKRGSISTYTNFIPWKSIYKFVHQISHKKPYLSYSINSGTIIVSLLDVPKSVTIIMTKSAGHIWYTTTVTKQWC